MTTVVRPRLVGEEQEVPLVMGGRTRYINLDYAASAPPLAAVARAVAEIQPWYSSVHRGTGFKSQISTAAYEGARQAVHAFLRLRPDDAVIFTRNTTDSINLLAGCLSSNARVITPASEHHANMLPWRRHQVDCLPVPSGQQQLLESLEGALREAHAAQVLVAVTGASNVTGEIWPLQAIVDISHKYGARVFVDAAQLAPHVPIDVAALGIDYLALSGHKLYAPFGIGVLAGRPDWLTQEAPFLMGGGAVEFVTVDDVLWSALPDRQEAGSPNVIGAVALGVACQTLDAFGMDRIAEEESDLYAYARSRLAAVPNLELYALWDDSHAHIGVLTFNLAGYHYGKLASILSAEYGIGVRHGCFCAHPLMLSLLRVPDSLADEIRVEIMRGQRSAVPGAVRMSVGLASTHDDIDALVEALLQLTKHGPRWTYWAVADTNDYVPEPDTRVYPNLPFALKQTCESAGESS